jgi:carbon storage regulator
MAALDAPRRTALPTSPDCKETSMLLLSRKKQESIVIDGRITVTVLGCGGGRVRIGVTAPANVKILRQELLNTQKRELAS